MPLNIINFWHLSILSQLPIKKYHSWTMNIVDLIAEKDCQLLRTIPKITTLCKSWFMTMYKIFIAWGPTNGPQKMISGSRQCLFKNRQSWNMMQSFLSKILDNSSWRVITFDPVEQNFTYTCLWYGFWGWGIHFWS